MKRCLSGEQWGSLKGGAALFLDLSFPLLPFPLLLQGSDSLDSMDLPEPTFDSVPMTYYQINLYATSNPLCVILASGS
jgi:hypothetical protein